MESSLSNALRHVCKEAPNVVGRNVMRQRYDHGSTQNSSFVSRRLPDMALGAVRCREWQTSTPMDAGILPTSE
jgi:hypothetical protein